MKIYSMTATFGKLENQTLTLTPGLNVIQGPNEWGKSTWSAFLVAMLYGIDTRERTKTDSLADKERYAPWSGSPMAGSMELEWQGRRITIQRRNKGRAIFSEFLAFETDTGIAVPELTATNCGEQLLGVEKNVFTRAGFLRLTDLPVTQDESLRRRLNALVTTGDESGTSDVLAQRLRDLKNACKSNRANGLIPKAEAQKAELENTLGQIRQLRQLIAYHRDRQEELTDRQEKLENHAQALRYQENLGYAQKLAAAETAADRAAMQEKEQSDRCAALPSPTELQTKLQQIYQLRSQKEDLQTELQLLGQAPQMPEPPEAFRNMNANAALEHATLYRKTYEQVDKERRNWVMAAVGGTIALAGVLLGILLAYPWFTLIALGGALIGIGENVRRRAKNTQKRLREKFSGMEPEAWIPAAENWGKTLEAAEQAQLQHGQKRQALEERAAALKAMQEELARDGNLASAEQACKDAQEQHRALETARRELDRCRELVQTLRLAYTQVSPAPKPDELICDRADTQRLLSECQSQLREHQKALSHLQGQIEALGQEEVLQRQLQQVQQRLCKLEQTYSALDLAQQILTQASAELQRRFAPRIAQRARDLFGKLTGSRYDRLTLTEDLSVMAGAEGEPTLHAARWRSDGTVDQLYLALRLAVAEELTPDAPLVLDDALVRFDDTRLAAAMEILKEYAGSKQVILFTCQSREKNLIEGEKI